MNIGAMVNDNSNTEYSLHSFTSSCILHYFYKLDLPYPLLDPSLHCEPLRVQQTGLDLGSIIHVQIQRSHLLTVIKNDNQGIYRMKTQG